MALSDWDQLQRNVDILRLDMDVKEAQKLKEHAHSEVAFCLENDCAERAWENLFFRIDHLEERLGDQLTP